MSKPLTELQVLRNRMARATQAGRAEEAARLRRELAVGALLRDIRKRLDDIVLDPVEADRLVAAVLEHRDRDELEREALKRAEDVQRMVELLSERLRAGEDGPSALRGVVQESALEAAAAV